FSRDWSSDVCSSDLRRDQGRGGGLFRRLEAGARADGGVARRTDRHGGTPHGEGASAEADSFRRGAAQNAQRQNPPPGDQGGLSGTGGGRSFLPGKPEGGGYHPQPPIQLMRDQKRPGARRAFGAYRAMWALLFRVDHHMKWGSVCGGIRFL